MSRPSVEVVGGDLLNQNVEIIVNAWNRNIIPWWMLLPQGVSGAIKRRAGKSPFREVDKHGVIPPHFTISPWKTQKIGWLSAPGQSLCSRPSIEYDEHSGPQETPRRKDNAG